jgi:hypothetical protein
MACSTHPGPSSFSGSEIPLEPFRLCLRQTGSFERIELQGFAQVKRCLKREHRLTLSVESSIHERRFLSLIVIDVVPRGSFAHNKDQGEGVPLQEVQHATSSINHSVDGEFIAHTVGRMRRGFSEIRS